MIHKVPKRNCMACNKRIDGMHGRAKRCLECSKIYKREYLREYMAKYSMRKSWEVKLSRTEDDSHILNDNHMVGLGTFNLPVFKGLDDVLKEYALIKKLKSQARIK